MKAPFPYFGGKSRVAHKVWAALGDPAHYIEPFFGSGAVLLKRDEYIGKVETVNDKDGLLCNVWRSLQFAPDEVARWCDWPVNHIDLNVRRKVLTENMRKLSSMLQSYDDYYDAKLAGYWIWAASCWIGDGLTGVTAAPNISHSGHGVHSKRPHIGHAGKGINVAIPYLKSQGMGVRSKAEHVKESIDSPSNAFRPELYHWFRDLQERLRNVRVVCGEWYRVCGGNWHDSLGICGFFFDPPYGVDDRDSVYHHDSPHIANDVMLWCLEHGQHPNYRIVLCGYEEHEKLLNVGWTMEKWKANGGYGNQAEGRGKNNAGRERIYYSPHCIKPEVGLFDV